MLLLHRNQYRCNLKILYDGRVFQFQRREASSATLRRSSLICEETIILSSPVWRISENNVPSHRNLERASFKLSRPRRFSVPLCDKWWKSRLLRQLDLFHPTYYHLTCGSSFSRFQVSDGSDVYDFVYAIYPKLIERSEGVAIKRRRSGRRTISSVFPRRDW